MRLLALETSSDTCSTALMDGLRVIERDQVLPAQQGQVLLDWISSLLAQHALSLDQLDAVCYSAGPGSFTGVRMGAAIAQGIALACQIPIIAVSSLQVMAQGVYRELACQQVMIIAEARMQQAYCGYYSFKDDLMQKTAPDQLSHYAD